MKPGIVSLFIVMGLALCNASEDVQQLCFQREQCTAPCYACASVTNDVVLCLNATDLEHTSPGKGIHRVLCTALVRCAVDTP